MPAAVLGTETRGGSDIIPAFKEITVENRRQPSHTVVVQCGMYSKRESGIDVRNAMPGTASRW